MTIRELFREFAIAKERRANEREAALSLAWHTAAFHRVEKLPKLETILQKARRSGPQTPAEQRTMIHILSDQLGIPVRRVRLIHKDAA